MNIDALLQLIAIVLPLSVASERLVEIIKGYVPYLSKENPDPVADGRRRACIQTLAIVAGIVTAYLASGVITLPSPLLGLGAPEKVLGLGLLASGGSSFWNAILGYVTKVKELKKTEVEIQKARSDAARAEADIALARGGPVTPPGMVRAA